MPDIQPQAKTEGERILLLEAAAVEDLQEFNTNRMARDQWLWATVIALVGVVALFITAYIRP